VISIPGKLYDGKTSRTIDAVFNSDADGNIRVTQDGHRLISADLDQLKISDRLGNTPRYIHFPGGEKFETCDNPALDGLLSHFAQGSWMDRVHFFETRIQYVLISLAVLLVLIWSGVRYGVPAASKAIAHVLPARTLSYAGTRTLEILDKSVFKPTQLPNDRQKNLMAHFRPMLDAYPNLGLEIIFRKGGSVGPNAFALPNGVIIFTDEMIQTATHDDQLSAVLLHEMGHIIHRHGMRTVIQNSLLGFALLTFTGDVTGSAELFMGLPLFLTQMAYARKFESEADQFALNQLRQAGIPPIHFANLMDRINKKITVLDKESDKDWWSYLSTHPRMEERLLLFRNGTAGE